MCIKRFATSCSRVNRCITTYHIAYSCELDSSQVKITSYCLFIIVFTHQSHFRDSSLLQVFADLVPIYNTTISKATTVHITSYGQNNFACAAFSNQYFVCLQNYTLGQKENIYTYPYHPQRSLICQKGKSKVTTQGLNGEFRCQLTTNCSDGIDFQSDRTAESIMFLLDRYLKT